MLTARHRIQGHSLCAAHSDQTNVNGAPIPADGTIDAKTLARARVVQKQKQNIPELLPTFFIQATLAPLYATALYAEIDDAAAGSAMYEAPAAVMTGAETGPDTDPEYAVVDGPETRQPEYAPPGTQ